MAKQNALGTFEGKDVRKTTISVRNAGDGLSQAMEVDPQLLHQGDSVYVVMECAVGPVSFDPIKGSESECIRKHVLRAGAATIVDGDLVKAAVIAQTEKIIAAREAAAGVRQLHANDETLRMAHADGEHDDVPHDGCPVCHPPHEPRARKPRAAKNATKAPTKRARKAPAKK